MKPTTIDIVIVTLQRPSLKPVVERMKKVIPNCNFIYVTQKGQLGYLRNVGLARASTDLVAFVDDDVLITKEWFDEAMERLKAPGVICVGGGTMCMLAKTKEFKTIGGFPSFDSHVTLKEGVIVLSESYGCVHYATDLDLFKHAFKWFKQGYEHAFPFGHNNGISPSFKLILQFLRQQRPLISLVHSLWLVKAMYVKAFKLIGMHDVRESKPLRVENEKQRN